MFLMLKRECEKMKIKTCVCLFFQMSFLLRVGAVILELNEASI